MVYILNIYTTLVGTKAEEFDDVEFYLVDQVIDIDRLYVFVWLGNSIADNTTKVVDQYLIWSFNLFKFKPLIWFYTFNLIKRTI